MLTIIHCCNHYIGHWSISLTVAGRNGAVVCGGWGKPNNDVYLIVAYCYQHEQGIIVDPLHGHAVCLSVHRKREMAHQVPTTVFLKLSPDRHAVCILQVSVCA